MLIVANYHYIRESFDDPYPSIFGITPARFRAQLELLGSAGTFVSLEDVAAAAGEGPPLPDRALLVTFDDALREQYETALPILRELGIPAVFFSNTRVHDGDVLSTVHMIHLLRSRLSPGNFLAEVEREAGLLEIRPGLEAVDAGEASRQYRYDDPAAARLKYFLNFQMSPGQQQRLIGNLFDRLWPESPAAVSRRLYMDVGQLRSLAGSRSLGSHGHEHLPMGKLAPEEMRRQLEISWGFLEQWGHQGPRAFAFPYGSQEACSENLRGMAGPLGIVCGFTMERAANESPDNPLFLSRFSNDDLPGGNHPRLALERLFEDAPVATWFRNRE